MRELRTLDEGEDDRVLEAGEDASDPVEVERVAAEGEVEERGGHRWAQRERSRSRVRTMDVVSSSGQHESDYEGARHSLPRPSHRRPGV